MSCLSKPNKAKLQYLFISSISGANVCICLCDCHCIMCVCLCVFLSKLKKLIRFIRSKQRAFHGEERQKKLKRYETDHFLEPFAGLTPEYMEMSQYHIPCLCTCTHLSLTQFCYSYFLWIANIFWRMFFGFSLSNNHICYYVGNSATLQILWAIL